MNNNELIYISRFKLYNVEIESKRIELAKDAWIEKDAKYIQSVPNYFLQFLVPGFSDQQFGLSRYYQQLFASEVAIITTNTSQEEETKPLDLHECTYIAMAISLWSDYWFVAGIETFFNSRDGEKLGSSGPYSSRFSGKKDGKVTIKKTDEPLLREIYNFVYQTLRSSTLDERKLRLLFLYFGCVIKSSSQQIQVLKYSYPRQFSGDTGAIIYSAIFFEHVFTKESWPDQVEKGVRRWNKQFPTAKIKWEDVKILIKFRHTLVHDSAEGANEYIKEWKKNHKVPDSDLIFKLEEIIVHNVKQVMRMIVLDYKGYEAFRMYLSS